MFVLCKKCCAADASMLAELVECFCRLSDFLFVTARYVAMREGRQETVYRCVDTEPLVNEKNKNMM